MKLLRLKITDPAGFRSLHCGFEHHFRKDWSLQEELNNPQEFAPFVCAGPNGSGKSNLLEVLAAIFYHMECIYLDSLPDSFRHDEDNNPGGFRSEKAIPDGFLIEYLIQPQSALELKGHNGHNGHNGHLHVRIIKKPGEKPKWFLLNHDGQEGPAELITGQSLTRKLLPDYVLGYSSGENEILSLPFFKIRYIQFDEYWQRLSRQLDYPGRPESRLIYLDSGFSQAILVCNLLLQNDSTLGLFRKEVGIEALREFRIIIRRSISITSSQLEAFDDTSQDEKSERISRIRAENPRATDFQLQGLIRDEIIKTNAALTIEKDEQRSSYYRLNVVHLLEGDEKSSIIEKLKRCATLSYHDEASDTLILDYLVNDETREVFRSNFEDSPLSLFQALQVLLILNLYSVSDNLKTDIYRSKSHYVSETVPTLASDERIMRFKNFYFKKQGIAKPMLLKALSDGEHQLLHSAGLCLLFRNTNSLFLLDEPETHFNPAWRASFVSRLCSCLQGPAGTSQEMLITTHSPFLISDSKPDRVLVFDKNPDTGSVSITHPHYNTLGASINKITHETFQKSETIGELARQVLEQLLSNPIAKTDPHGLAQTIMNTVGDSIERTLAIHTLLQLDQKTKAEKE